MLAITCRRIVSLLLKLVCRHKKAIYEALLIADEATFDIGSLTIHK